MFNTINMKMQFLQWILVKSQKSNTIKKETKLNQRIHLMLIMEKILIQIMFNWDQLKKQLQLQSQHHRICQTQPISQEEMFWTDTTLPTLLTILTNTHLVKHHQLQSQNHKIFQILQINPEEMFWIDTTHLTHLIIHINGKH